jgi:thioredoxin reductase
MQYDLLIAGGGAAGSFAAARAAARVEFVSPYTRSQSGFSFINTSSMAIIILPVIWAWEPPEMPRL